MLRAALTSRSRTFPQSQTISLIPRPRIPLGLPLGRTPQQDVVWEVQASLASIVPPPFLMDLYENIPLRPAHPASRTLFAKRDLAIFDGLTSPTTISPYSFAIFAVTLCCQSFRRLAILAWIRRMRFGVFLALCKFASFASLARKSRGA